MTRSCWPAWCMQLAYHLIESMVSDRSIALHHLPKILSTFELRLPPTLKMRCERRFICMQRIAPLTLHRFRRNFGAAKSSSWLRQAAKGVFLFGVSHALYPADSTACMHVCTSICESLFCGGGNAVFITVLASFSILFLLMPSTVEL